MKSSDIRKKFLDYFASKQHQLVSSSSLVPGNDPTLLFTNAGMVQFKDVFLGSDPRSYVRAASSQRCLRAGGKHNDLENVGYTARHHTFFEMLGNFSFGDYFKKDAIHFAWEFLTNTLKLPKEKLWVTVFETDDEAAAIWQNEIGIPAERIVRLGEKSNFWSMGDTGPCGPCTEIFYDHGTDIAGGPPGSPDEDGDRYIEIWNIVFMQYNRTADGKMTALPKPSVDTGMGLERLAAVLQHVHNNYDTDVFKPLIDATQRIYFENHKNVDTGKINFERARFNIIADHIRSTSFLIADGVLPSNEGRGYVLRRIIRRALRHGYKLELASPFFYKLVPTLVQEMGAAYPELVTAQAQITQALKQEEEQFAKTLEQGLKIFEQETKQLKDKMLPGELIFKLYDTYGFPVDMTADMARERDWQLDMPGFEAAMQQQRQQSKAASKFDLDYNSRINIEQTTDFAGYETLATDAMVTAIIKGTESVQTLNAGEEGVVILDRTPFYAQGGGQVGDTGNLENASAKFIVTDTQKVSNAHLHHGKLVHGTISVNDKLSTQVDADRRQAIRLNHTATHLLHAALHKVLGVHVQQKGSLVEAERLRLDFSNPTPVTSEQLADIEYLVNQMIRENVAGVTEMMSLDDAKASGAQALFGEKYGAKVRVLSFGEFSKELCGGTHVQRTGDLGLFKITMETSVASGIRRIEAMTGAYALGYVDQACTQVDHIANELNIPRATVEGKVLQLQARNRELEKEIEQLKTKLSVLASSELVQQAEVINGIKVLFVASEQLDAKNLRTISDELKNKLGSAIILLAAWEGDRVTLMATISKDLITKIKAGDLVNQAAVKLGGKGGGRPEQAQAGGTDPKEVPTAMIAAKEWLVAQLK
jgi:alanyl-tRNA synthetase